MSAYLDFLIARPKGTLLLVYTLTAVIAVGALRMKVDFSPEQVYVGQDDAVDFCERHKRHFRFEDSIVLVILESSDGQSLIREDCLNWMREFAERSRKLDGVREVTSIATLERPRIRPGSDAAVTWTPLLLEEYYSDADYVADQLSRVPLLNDTLVSKDDQMMLTLIDLDPDQRKISQATKRVNAIKKIISNLPLPSKTSTFISGVPAIRVDVIRSIIDDQLQMVPVCAALFLFVSMVMFRSITVTLLALSAALTAMGLTMGFMGWAGITFSVMSNVIPALLLIIAAASNVHVLSRFQVELRQTDDDVKVCAKSTLMEMSKTCFLTLTTTGIGFGSLLIARAELLQSLAVQAAAGMAFCYVGLITVMPQTLTICGPILARQIRTKRSETPSDSSDSNVAKSTVIPSRLDGLWQVAGRLISRYSAPIFVFHMALAAWTLWSCRDIAINSYMFETYDGDHPTMQAVRKMDERLSGLISLEVQLQAGHRDRFFESDVVEALANARVRIPQDERVTFYRDYIEFVSVFDRGRALSEDPAEASASMRRVKLALKQIDDPQVTSTFLGTEEPVARVMMRIRDVGSAGMQDMIARVTEIMQNELPGDVKFRMTGDAFLHAVCMDAFTRDLFYSLIAASGVIFMLITLLFRSLRIGLISAVPNMFPLVMTLGYMYLRGYELTAGNVIVFAISLGIAVDDTIHFLARYRDDRRNAEPKEAIQQTLVTSGRAIVLTSVLVVSGLSILVFSDFVPTRRFAELTAITMCSALPGDVVLLPAMLMLFGSRHGKAK